MLAQRRVAQARPERSNAASIAAFFCCLAAPLFVLYVQRTQPSQRPVAIITNIKPVTALGSGSAAVQPSGTHLPFASLQDVRAALLSNWTCHRCDQRSCTVRLADHTQDGLGAMTTRLLGAFCVATKLGCNYDHTPLGPRHDAFGINIGKCRSEHEPCGLRSLPWRLGTEAIDQLAHRPQLHQCGPPSWWEIQMPQAEDVPSAQQLQAPSDLQVVCWLRQQWPSMQQAEATALSRSAWHTVHM